MIKFTSFTSVFKRLLSSWHYTIKGLQPLIMYDDIDVYTQK